MDAGLDVFVDLKAFAVFSLLFGIGLAIQHQRLERQPRRVELLARRLLALLAIGLIHLPLIWNGDILTEYGPRRVPRAARSVCSDMASCRSLSR